MLHETWTRLPVRVRIAPFETPDSYETRVREANRYSKRAWNTLVQQALRDDSTATRAGLIEVLGGLRQSHFEAYKTRASHAQDEPCGSCLNAVDVRYACTRCTGGAVARQAPHDGPRVCRRHMRWVGPGEVDEQRTVGAEVLGADRLYRRLRGEGAVDAHRLAEILACVDAWTTAGGLRSTAPAQFVIAVELARAFQRLRTECADGTAAERYAALTEATAAVVGHAADVLVDSLWLALRADRHRGDSAHAFELWMHTGAHEDGELAVLTTSFYPRVRHLQLTQLVRSPAPGTRFDQAARLDDDNDYVCPRGHAFSSTGRVLMNSKASGGCGYCARKKVAPGNSLADTHPHLAAEWHTTENGDVRPTDVLAGTGTEYTWLCPARGHTYSASPNSRTSKGTGCGYCANVLVDETNSLRTTHPHLAQEWNVELNGGLTPDDVVAGSERSVWWTCPEGHDYETAVTNRTNGSQCLVCTHQQVHMTTCLAATHLDVAEWWDYKNNGDLTPSDVFAGSFKKVWWLCENGHSYDGAIVSRVKGIGCRYCSNRGVNKTNSMRVTHPMLAAEFHPTKNGQHTPDNVVAGTSRRLWWQCVLGHDWQVSGDNRVRQGTGCPYCSNKKVWRGFNDMATIRPDLAAEFHRTRNGELTPADVTAGTAKPLWWECENGHEWRATGDSRANKGRGCPHCPR